MSESFFPHSNLLMSSASSASNTLYQFIWVRKTNFFSIHISICLELESISGKGPFWPWATPKVTFTKSGANATTEVLVASDRPGKHDGCLTAAVEESHLQKLSFHSLPPHTHSHWAHAYILPGDPIRVCRRSFLLNERCARRCAGHGGVCHLTESSQ